MVLRPEPLAAAIDGIADQHRIIVYPSAGGRLFTQSTVETLRSHNHLVFVCGRYEGIDQRIIDHYADYELSIGSLCALFRRVGGNRYCRCGYSPHSRRTQSAIACRREPSRWARRISALYPPGSVAGHGGAADTALWRSCRNLCVANATKCKKDYTKQTGYETIVGRYE